MSVQPLALDGWLEYNRWKWGVTPLKVTYTAQGNNLPALDTVLYLDRRGRITLPSCNPFLPVRFRPTPTGLRGRRYRQWLAVCKELAADWRERGLAKLVTLGPEAMDARPLQWAGFKIGVHYTFQLDFPFDLAVADTTARRDIARSEMAGFRCERAECLEEVAACLGASARRKRFRHHVGLTELRCLRGLLSDDEFRLYICRAKDGSVASVRGVLHVPGEHAIDLLTGTMTAYLPTGATQLLVKYVLDDLAGSGAEGFDFEGANIESIGVSKMKWGARLVQYFVVEQYDLRGLARWCNDWLKFKWGRGLR